MVERGSVRQPVPDILTKQFVESVHPYTMMFLFLAYQEGAHKKMSQQQIRVFDGYFTGNKTFKDHKSKEFREVKAAIIRDGFKILRQNTSERINQFFNDNRLPYFKIGDIPFVNDSDIELKKHKFSDQSMRMMGSKLSEEHKRNIGIKMKGRRFSDETREKMRLAKLGTKQSDETIAKRMAKVNELWRDDEFRKRMKAISDSRRKANQEN